MHWINYCNQFWGTEKGKERAKIYHARTGPDIILLKEMKLGKLRKLSLTSTASWDSFHCFSFLSICNLWVDWKHNLYGNCNLRELTLGKTRRKSDWRCREVADWESLQGGEERKRGQKLAAAANGERKCRRRRSKSSNGVNGIDDDEEDENCWVKKIVEEVR